MKLPIAFACALFLVGCQKPPEPVTENPPEPEPGQSTPVPTETKTEPVAGTTGAPPMEGTHPNQIRERLYQLADYTMDTMTINGHKISVFLALNEPKRAEGLMHVLDKHLNMNRGMLFAFKDEAPRSFWMQNTKIDLDLAYIAKSGKVQSIHHMKALDEKPVPGKGPAMYVLEMKHGAFKTYGVKEGMTLKIPATAKSED